MAKISKGDDVAKFIEEMGGVDEAARALRETPLTARQRMAQAMGETGVRTVLPDPNRAYSDTLSTTQKGILGAGTIGGGTLVGSKYMDSREERAKREAQESQEDALENILTDGTLKTEEKQDLIDKLTAEGFFSSPFEEGDGSGDPSSFLGRIFGDPLADIGPVKFFFLLIILYYVGNALVNYAESDGGS